MAHQFVKIGSKGDRRFAIMRDRKETFAVLWQDAFSWKYIERGLTLPQAEMLLALKLAY